MDKDRNLISLKIWNNLNPVLKQYIDDCFESEI